MPFTGSIRVRSSCIALGDRIQPPIITGVATMAAMIARKIGPATRKASSVRPMAPSRITTGSNAAARLKVKPLRTTSAARCAIQPPKIQNVPAPAAITMKAISSRDCGTLPSSRACSSRRADAGSVFSRSLSSAKDGLSHAEDYSRRRQTRAGEKAPKPRPIRVAPKRAWKSLARDSRLRREKPRRGDSDRPGFASLAFALGLGDVTLDQGGLGVRKSQKLEAGAL